MTQPSFEARSDVTQTPAADQSSSPRRRKKTPGQLVAFTRHPTAVRTAMAALHAMHLRAADHVLMSALILACDREGIVWPKPKELASLTKLALNTVLASLRRLRKLALLDWRRLRPFADKWPLRVSYTQPVKLEHRVKDLCADHGGRVFVVRWEKFGVSFASRDLARKVEDRSKIDRSGSIPTDRSSDLSDLSSRDLKIDPAPSGDGCGSAPPLAADVEPLQSRGDAVAAREEPPPISSPASPPAAAAPRAPTATPGAPIARAGGEGALTGRDAAARMAADLARLGIHVRPPKG